MSLRFILVAAVAGAIAFLAASAVVSDEGGSSDSPNYALSIQMNNKFFSPDSIIVEVGDTITWVNAEGTHTTTSYNGAWDSGMMSVGQTFSWTANIPDVYRYKCVFHEGNGMVGQVTVAAPLLSSSSQPTLTLVPPMLMEPVAFPNTGAGTLAEDEGNAIFYLVVGMLVFLTAFFGLAVFLALRHKP